RRRCAPGDGRRLRRRSRLRRVPRPVLRRDRPAPQGQRERTLTIPRDSDEWKRLYRRRSAVERMFGVLKHNYGLATLRVRGIERVRLHADLVMLGRLATALS